MSIDLGSEEAKRQQQALKDNLKALIDDNFVWSSNFGYLAGDDITSVDISFVPSSTPGD